MFTMPPASCGRTISLYSYTKSASLYTLIGLHSASEVQDLNDFQRKRNHFLVQKAYDSPATLETVFYLRGHMDYL